MTMTAGSLNDTIAAIATLIGESGIGIVRLSGRDALGIADKIFVSKGKGRPSDFKTHTLHYGWISDNVRNKAVQSSNAGQRGIIDEVLLTVMRAPKTYTREDVVEINCHGGMVAMRRILDAVLENGCRLAEPGEFTKRAFLNGRIDLTQAEAVADIIKAKTDFALKAGMEQLKGGLSRGIVSIRDGLLRALVSLEAHIDFAEEDIAVLDRENLSIRLREAHEKITGIIESSAIGKVIRDGIRVVICGRSNVGKSSLLNALLRQERSIVTHIPGTTRDTIEEIIDIRGIPVRIADTAGILQPRDLIERKAMRKAREYMDAADLALIIFDGSQPLHPADQRLIQKLRKKTSIAVINKIDLRQRIQKEKIARAFNKVIEVSAKQARNLSLLEDAIAGLVYQRKLQKQESLLAVNRRHAHALKKARKLVGQALRSLTEGFSAEFVAQDIKDSLGHLDDISGKRFSVDLLDRIFSEFCVGK